MPDGGVIVFDLHVEEREAWLVQRLDNFGVFLTIGVCDLVEIQPVLLFYRCLQRSLFFHDGTYQEWKKQMNAIIKGSCAGLLALFLFVTAAAAADTGGLQQISAHVWAYVGTKDFSPAGSYGANAGMIVGEKAVMVVDTLISEKEGERLLIDIRKVTQLPIRYVVNTHYHLDHAWGNCAFDKKGVEFIGGNGAAELAKNEGEKALKNASAYGLTGKQMRGTEIRAADLSLDKPQTMDLGGVNVQLIPLLHGHCKDNLIAWVAEEKTLFAGDLVFAGCHPFMGEGDVAGWLENLDLLAASGAEKIIPGHGPLCGVKDVQEMKAYVQAFDKAAQELCAGKTQADAKAIAAELLKRLPAQNRTALEGMLENNLSLKYLAPASKTDEKK